MIRNSIIEKNQGPGIRLCSAHNAEVFNNIITSNKGIGLRVEDSKTVKIHNNTVTDTRPLAGGYGNGLRIEGSVVDLGSNLIKKNHRCGALFDQADGRMSFNAISENSIGLCLGKSKPAIHSSNAFHRNQEDISRGSFPKPSPLWAVAPQSNA